MYSKTKAKVSYFRRSIENCSWCQQWDTSAGKDFPSAVCSEPSVGVASKMDVDVMKFVIFAVQRDSS